MSVPTLVVMAAGMGSRYGGSKQVEPVGPGGELIIDYSVYDAMRAGFGKIVLIVRPEVEEVLSETLLRRVAGRIPIHFVHQRLDDLPEGFSAPAGRRKPWGTAHAVWAAREAVDEPFGVINADDFYGAEAFQTLAERLRGARDDEGVADWCLVGYVLWNTLSEHGSVSRGLCRVDARGRLVEIVERTKVEKLGDEARYSEDDGETWTTVDRESLVSMNMWGFTPSLFPMIERRFVEFLRSSRDDLKAELYLPAVVNDAMQAGEATVEVLETGARWFGMTYREDLETARREIGALVRQGVYPEILWGDDGMAR